MRNARGLARLFEFEEFERLIRKLSGHAPTLRVAADLSVPRIPPVPQLVYQLIGVLADKCSVISARHLTRQVGLANYFFRISVGSAHQLIN